MIEPRAENSSRHYRHLFELPVNSLLSNRFLMAIYETHTTDRMIGPADLYNSRCGKYDHAADEDWFHAGLLLGHRPHSEFWKGAINRTSGYWAT